MVYIHICFLSEHALIQFLCNCAVILCLLSFNSHFVFRILVPPRFNPKLVYLSYHIVCFSYLRIFLFLFFQRWQYMYIFVPLFNYEFPVRSARRRRQNLWNVCHKNFAKNASDAYRGFFRPALKSEKFVMPAGSPLALTHQYTHTAGNTFFTW